MAVVVPVDHPPPEPCAPLLQRQIRRAEEKRGQDDGSNGGAEEGEVRVGALGGAPGEAVWAGGYFIIVGFFVLFLLL